MSSTVWMVGIALVVLLAAALAATIVLRKHRTEKLRSRFGAPEYANAKNRGGGWR